MNQTDIHIEQDKTFDIIKRSVDKLVNLVRPTYGPASNKVIISRLTHRMIVDDGVQIARDLELSDPMENAVVQSVKEVAIRTNDRVGDGTTSSLIVIQAILSEVAKKRKWSGRKIEQELKLAVGEVAEQLRAQSRQIKTQEELEKVARVSYDDETIAKMISSLYFKLGKDAIITVDKSPTLETVSELSDGVTINRGYISPYMIANPERMETVLEKPYILVTDYRITEPGDIIPLMTKMAEQNKRELVIIAENVEQSALATLIVNKIQGKFFTVAINAPTDGDRKVALEDIALMLGARMFTESKGDKIEDATVDDLGRATRFICRREESVIIEPKGKKAEIATAITSLREAVKAEPDERRRKEIERRLARFENTIAVVKVGAPTENEQKALKYKVEDTVNAVREAFKGGVVPGAGLSLAALKTSSPILNEALKYPARQLRENMDLDGEPDLRKDHVLNVVTGEVGTFMDVGVADPVEVLIAGVESAVSIASILLTSSGMIVEAPKEAPNTA